MKRMRGSGGRLELALGRGVDPSPSLVCVGWCVQGERGLEVGS